MLGPGRKQSRADSRRSLFALLARIAFVYRFGDGAGRLQTGGRARCPLPPAKNLTQKFLAQVLVA